MKIENDNLFEEFRIQNTEFRIQNSEFRSECGCAGVVQYFFLLLTPCSLLTTPYI
jgi:hypothetical protein